MKAQRYSIKTFGEVPLPYTQRIKVNFVGDSAMFEDFPYGGWPCRYRAENVSVKKMFKVFSFGYTFPFVNLLSLSSVLRCCCRTSLMYAS